MPLMLLRPLSKRRRRLSKDWSMVLRAAFAADLFWTAARAPYWAKVVALEVVWLWSFETAFAMGSQAMRVPRRQPVIA